MSVFLKVLGIPNGAIIAAVAQEMTNAVHTTVHINMTRKRRMGPARYVVSLFLSFLSKLSVKKNPVSLCATTIQWIHLAGQLSFLFVGVATGRLLLYFLVRCVILLKVHVICIRR